MPHRIRNVLLVASLYDSFLLADDDRLNEALFGEMLDASEHAAPKITRVPTAEKAIEKLGKGRCDLIIAMIQVGETDMTGFLTNLKAAKPEVPVVLLSFNIADAKNIPDDAQAMVEGVFLWQGDTRIFSAIINLIEDKRNFEHDAEVGVQAVLLVEDNIKFYSSYLPIIYSELLKQTQIVMAEELNPAKKALRLKARPKILFTRNYDEAWEIYSRYKANLLGVISDIEYPIGSACVEDAGLRLTKKIKEENPDMPVLLQSSNTRFAAKAGELGATFMRKSAPDLSRQLRGFMVRYFGFGDFIFSDKNGLEFARATDLNTMTKLLKTVPAESVLYHASRNHFSKWLFARTEFEIAYNIRPKKISEFQDGEALRKYLIETLHQFIYKTQLGTVLKFDRKLFDAATPFAKIGSGSIGGKARGLAFVEFLLSKNAMQEKFEGARVTVPNTIVIATDVFDFFIEQNNLDSLIGENYTNSRIAELFERAPLPDYVRGDLGAALEKLEGPLVVRSSSLLEDSKTQPFAGVYKTYFLSNDSPDHGRRLEELEKAVKFVFASAFSREAQAYRKFTPHMAEEEKMAVMIQRVVGSPRAEGKRFYPDFAGVMQSYNYYPVPPLEPEDPIVHIALGLGKTIVEGYTSLRFSPAHPQNLHQFSTSDDFLRNSQKKFIALKPGGEGGALKYDEEPALAVFDADLAAADGTLAAVGSTYSHEDDLVYDDITRPGMPLITFAPILKNDLIPLASILNALSEAGKEAMGSNIELEFACVIDKDTKTAEFNILQMRPMVSRSLVKKVHLEELKQENLVCQSPMTLGNGCIKDVFDIIYVKPETFNSLKTLEIVEQIGELNQRLKGENRHYLLLGPGRWGSSDPMLGIPVKWDHISNSKIIVEADYEGFSVDPSYGTHFFHNVTSLGIGYFTINSYSKGGFINWPWLKSREVFCELPDVKHLRLASPLDIRVDGSQGHGAAAFT